MSEIKTEGQWVAQVAKDAEILAETLKGATEDGVSHALILPRLIMVFRESFGFEPSPEMLGQIAGIGEE